MSEQARDQQQSTADVTEYGSLGIEDDPSGTVDPADLAGTADDTDQQVGYEPAVTEADDTTA